MAGVFSCEKRRVSSKTGGPCEISWVWGESQRQKHPRIYTDDTDSNWAKKTKATANCAEIADSLRVLLDEPVQTFDVFAPSPGLKPAKSGDVLSSGYSVVLPPE